MKNKMHIPDDKFDLLPTRTSRHTEDMSKGFNRLCEWNVRLRTDLPYKRIKRYLMSRVGVPWDIILSEFVRLDWLPVRYRNIVILKEIVQVNTFRNGLGICFYDDSYSSSCFHVVNEQLQEVFYLYPSTEILCYKRPNKKYKWKPEQDKNLIILGELNQLIKLNGIWYHVYVHPKDTLYKVGEFSKGALLEGDGSSQYKSTDKFFVVKIQKKQLNTSQLKHYGLKNN